MKKRWKLYDELRSDLQTDFMEQIDVWYEKEFWSGAVTDEVDEDFLLTDFPVMHQPVTDMVVLDIEQWDMRDGFVADEQERLDNRDKYLTVLSIMKQHYPAKSVSFYARTPTNRDGYMDETPGNISMGRVDLWTAENAKLLPLATAQDVFYPQFYMPTRWDEKMWGVYAKAVMKQIKLLDKHKPVIPFLQPWTTPDRVTTDSDIIAGSTWRKMLEFCRHHTDGAVLWARGAESRWDETSDWWLETKKFVKDHRLV